MFHNNNRNFQLFKLIPTTNVYENISKQVTGITDQNNSKIFGRVIASEFFNKQVLRDNS